MDTINIEPVQNVDDEGGDVVGDCLNNSVVVRKIFQYFSSTELLELSLVNKLWSYEARAGMRNRENIFARVRCTDNQPCQQKVEAFLSVTRRMNQNPDLQQTNLVPFTGISIQLTPWGHTCQDFDQNLFHDVLFDKLVLKKINIDVFGEFYEFEDCPGLQLIKKVFHDCSRGLEELSLIVEHERKDFMEQVVQDCRFPRLKVLKLQETYQTANQDYTNYMKELVSRAPRLQELQTEGSINSMINALEGSSAVIKCQRTLQAPFDEISETAVGSLRLEKISLSYFPELDFERFNRMTPMLLQASCTATLRSMFVSAMLAVPLMCYGTRLEEVEDLDMLFNYGELELSEPWVLAIVKDFDFTRIFPKLIKVKIQGGYPAEVSTDLRNRIIAQANANLREPRPDRAVNVKELYLDCGSFSSETAQYFAEMFPNVEKLDLEAEASQEVQILFGSIWKHWKNLKDINVRGNIIQTTGNLDSVFCGLFPEEVAELRLQSDEYLKRVNIVPVMPAITCLRNLRTLTLSHQDYSYEAFDNGPTFMFSKVTALIAFARCPTLAVGLNITSYVAPPAMAHLKPYVSVKSVLLKEEMYDDDLWPLTYFSW